MAASAVGSTAGAYVGAVANTALAGAQDSIGKFGVGLISGTMAGIASGATVSAMRGGRVDVLRVAADAFGNALANSLVEELQPAGEKVIWEEAQRKADSEALARDLAEQRVRLANLLSNLKLKPGFDYSNVPAEVTEAPVSPAAEPGSAPASGAEQDRADSAASRVRRQAAPSSSTQASDTPQPTGDDPKAADPKPGDPKPQDRQPATPATAQNTQVSSVGNSTNRKLYKWDGQDTWRDEKGYDPNAPRSEKPKAKTPFEVDMGLSIKFEGPGTTIPLFGDPNLPTLSIGMSGGAEVKRTADGVDASLGIGLSAEMSWAMRKEAIVLPGGAQQTFSGQVRSAASAQGSLDASFTPGKMGFEAKGSLEAVLLQARGETVFDFDKYGITVGVEGALNAVAVAVSGGAVAQNKNGTIRTGVGLGFSALFGGRASFSVSINALKLLDAINPWRTFGTSPRP